MAIEHEDASLAALGSSVSPDYQHDDKLVTVGGHLTLPGACLKWYDIRRPGAETPATLTGESRAFLQAEVAAGRLAFAGEMGFVELHLCGAVALLLVSAWRNENELWEAVYRKDLNGTDGFVAFEDRSGHRRATYCVWELAPVWHERQAWRRYLRSTRDDEARRAYLADHYAGLC